MPKQSRSEDADPGQAPKLMLMEVQDSHHYGAIIRGEKKLFHSYLIARQYDGLELAKETRNAEVLPGIKGDATCTHRHRDALSVMHVLEALLLWLQ